MGCVTVECYPCFYSFSACFLLAVLYVASLYVWGSRGSRDDPRVIQKRTVSVLVVTAISPLVTNFFLVDETLTRVPLNHVLGFRSDGLLTAAILPLLLTIILFLGPMYLRQWQDRFLPFDYAFLRNMIVAPFTEEMTFRACMMPLLVQHNCLRPLSAVFVCPLLFGLGHIHHAVETRRMGLPLRNVVMMAAFQFFYTTLFGAYSSLLFIKTGHFIAPFLAHAYCNWMGFPDFGQVLEAPYPRRIFLGSLFVLGLVLWCLLLPPLTNHTLYNNTLYTKTQ